MSEVFQIKEKQPSLQMRAVLHVLKADLSLHERVIPFINPQTETIFWHDIFRLGFGDLAGSN